MKRTSSVVAKISALKSFLVVIDAKRCVIPVNVPLIATRR